MPNTRAANVHATSMPVLVPTVQVNRLLMEIAENTDLTYHSTLRNSTPTVAGDMQVWRANAELHVGGVGEMAKWSYAWGNNSDSLSHVEGRSLSTTTIPLSLSHLLQELRLTLCEYSL